MASPASVSLPADIPLIVIALRHQFAD